MGHLTHSLYDQTGNRLYLTELERTRFLEAAKSQALKWQNLAEFLIFSGCRISEALSVRAGHFDLEQNFVLVETLKQRQRGMWRRIPLDRSFLNELDKNYRLKAHQTSGNRQMQIWPICRTTAWTHIKKILRDADIHGPHACPKGLRHTYGTHAMLNGVPITLIKKWMGHARLASTEIYLDVMGTEEYEIAKKMWVEKVS